VNNSPAFEPGPYLRKTWYVCSCLCLLTAASTFLYADALPREAKTQIVNRYQFFSNSLGAALCLLGIVLLIAGRLSRRIELVAEELERTQRDFENRLRKLELQAPPAQLPPTS